MRAFPVGEIGIFVIAGPIIFVLCDKISSPMHADRWIVVTAAGQQQDSLPFVNVVRKGLAGIEVCNDLVSPWCNCTLVGLLSAVFHFELHHHNLVPMLASIQSVQNRLDALKIRRRCHCFTIGSVIHQQLSINVVNVKIEAPDPVIELVTFPKILVVHPNPFVGGIRVVGHEQEHGAQFRVAEISLSRRILVCANGLIRRIALVVAGVVASSGIVKDLGGIGIIHEAAFWPLIAVHPPGLVVGTSHLSANRCCIRPAFQFGYRFRTLGVRAEFLNDL